VPLPAKGRACQKGGRRRKCEEADFCAKEGRRKMIFRVREGKKKRRRGDRATGREKREREEKKEVKERK
jgi:hypothetical protein